MNPNKPIRRSEALIPLSHDHQHGLVIARRVGEGLKRRIDPGRIIAYVVDFWDNELEEHFREEETVIFPLLPTDDARLARAVEEHRRIRGYVQQMAGPLSDSAAILAALAALLQAHIRFEERELFPYIERSASAEELAQAGAALHKDVPARSLAWEDEFWTDAGAAS